MKTKYDLLTGRSDWPRGKSAVLCAILALCLPHAPSVAQPGPTTVNASKHTAAETAQTVAGKKVADFNRAIKTGDPVQIRKAALELQADPIAVQRLNQSGQQSLVKSHNEVIGKIKADTVSSIKQSVADDWNLKNPSKPISADDVRVYQPTNYKDPNATVKAGQDWDVTVQVKKPGATDWVDVPSTQAKPIVEKSYFNAAGGENTFGAGATAQSAAHRQSVEVTDKFSAESYKDVEAVLGKDGAKPDYNKQLQDPEQLAKAIEHKSNIAINDSVDATKVGNAQQAAGSEMEQFRQSSKQYDKIVTPRVEAAGGKVNSHVDEGMAIVRDVGDMKISPEQGRAKLAKIGETPESIISKAAGQVEAAQKLKPVSTTKVSEVVGKAAVAVDILSNAQDVKEKLQKGDIEGAAVVAGKAGANALTLGLSGAAEANIVKGADRDAATADIQNANATNTEAYRLEIANKLRKSGVSENEALKIADAAAAGDTSAAEAKFQQLKITMPEKIVEGPVKGDDTIFSRGLDVLVGFKDATVKAGTFLKETGQDLWEIGSGLPEKGVATEITDNLKDGAEVLTRHGDDRAMAEAAKAQIIEKLVAKGATPEGANKAAQAIIYGHDPEPLRNLNQLLDQKAAAQNGGTKTPTPQATTPKNTAATTPAKTATTTTPQATSPTTKTGAGTTPPIPQKTVQTIASVASQVADKADEAARQKLAQTVASAATSVAQKAENNQIVREGETHTGRGGTITTKDGTTRMDYVDDGKGGTKLVISNYDNNGNLLDRARENTGSQTGDQRDTTNEGGQHTGRGGTITTKDGTTRMDYVDDGKGGTDLVVTNYDKDGKLVDTSVEKLGRDEPPVPTPDIPDPDIPDADMPDADVPEPPKAEEPKKEIGDNMKVVKRKVPKITMVNTFDEMGNITGYETFFSTVEISVEVPWNAVDPDISVNPFTGETTVEDGFSGGSVGGETNLPKLNYSGGGGVSSGSGSSAASIQQTIVPSSPFVPASTTSASAPQLATAPGNDEYSYATQDFSTRTQDGQASTVTLMSRQTAAPTQLKEIGAAPAGGQLQFLHGGEWIDAEEVRSRLERPAPQPMQDQTQAIHPQWQQPAADHGAAPTTPLPAPDMSHTQPFQGDMHGPIHGNMPGMQQGPAHEAAQQSLPIEGETQKQPDPANEPAGKQKNTAADTPQTTAEGKSSQRGQPSSAATPNAKDTPKNTATEASKKAAAATTKTAAKTISQTAAPTTAIEAAKQAVKHTERDAAQTAAKTAAQQAAKTASQQAARQAAQTAAQQASRTAAGEAGRTASQQAAKVVNVAPPPPPPPPPPPHHHP